MDSKSGGLSSDARQRQTAAEIARQKVVASYSNTNKYKEAPIQTKQQTTDWKKYHSAWQNYYQKYYSDYYAKAAKAYIQTERKKNEKLRKDLEYQRQMVEAGTVEQPRKIIVSAPEPEPRKQAIVSPADTPESTEEEKQNIAQILKEKIQKKASDTANKRRKMRRWVPAALGVSVVLLALFMQYNRLIFAPIMAYVSPGNVSDDGITAIDATVTAAPGPDPKLIIPKLNVEVPINFGISNDEATVMEAMNHGVAQFAIPGANAMPGEIGNLVISGHSAGDIYSNNQYKFIFSGLERLVAGDIIYVNYDSKRYTYSVTELKTVEPTDVNSLIVETTRPMLTLVTCTPLGTSRYRLLVFAEQVDPAPESAKQSTQIATGDVNDGDKEMPSNSPSFFESIWRWLTGQS